MPFRRGIFEHKSLENVYTSQRYQRNVNRIFKRKLIGFFGGGKGGRLHVLVFQNTDLSFFFFNVDHPHDLFCVIFQVHTLYDTHLI